jgi:transcriptional regulator with XRE-family HTH domain
MKKTKKDTFIWEGLGFPIRLINVPMRKVFGEWVLDINLEYFQKIVLLTLARKPASLSGAELRFIIDYLQISTREFAQLFGVTHAAVLKWENEKSRMNPCTEVCVRLYILDYLKIADKEFRRSYLKISHQNLSNSESEESLLEIDAEKIA